MKVQNQNLMWLCRIMEIVLTAGVVFLPLIGQALNWLTQHPIENIVISPVPQMMALHDYTILSVTGLMGDLVQSFILWQCVLVFRAIRKGDIFSSILIKRVRYAGGGFILNPLIIIISSLIQSILIKNVSFNLMINDLSYLLLGLGLIILSHVVDIGKVIHDENRYVI